MKDLRWQIMEIQRLVGTRADGVFGPETAGAVLRMIKNEESDGSDAADGSEVVLDARSERVVGTLDEKARGKMRKFLGLAKATAATLGVEYVAISGTRTMKEQERLYQAWRAGTGGKAAPAGYSWHNFGTAIDCGVFRGGKYLDEAEPKTAERVHRACAGHAAACRLEWGGAWIGKSCDPPHYQIDMGVSAPTAEHRRRFAEKGSVL